MTGPVWLVAVLLTGAAVAVAWPLRGGRARRHAVLDLGNHPGPGDTRPTCIRPGAGHGPNSDRPGAGLGPTCVRSGAGPGPVVRTPHPRVPHPPGRPTDRPPAGRPPGRRDPTRPAAGLIPTDSVRTRESVRVAHPRRSAPRSGLAAALVVLDRAPRFRMAAAFRYRRSGAVSPSSESAPSGVVGRSPWSGRPALLAAAVVGAGAGALLGGPVAAVVLAAYGTLAARAVLRRRVRRAADRAHRHDLDQLGALAADLRAGLPAGGAIGDGPRRVARLARAAVRLADRTGAPLAELLERVEADARAADRGLAAAAAQAAGARATAWLLAGLPLGGIGLGYAIGVDPVAVLLHTPVGGGSAVAAVALQLGGLLWAERLGAAPGRAA